MDRQPLVSVILPTYNRAPLLRLTVASVLAQTYPAWELVILDDGSTDDTAAWLATLTDPRIRIVTRPHCGNSAILRNVGARLSRGEYLAWLDSDDIWRPRKLEAQVTALLANPASGWNNVGLVHIDGEGRVTGRPQSWRLREGWVLEDFLAVRAAAQTSTVMVSRALFEAAGAFNEELVRCQDFDLWLRLAERSPATVVNEELVEFRQHAGNRRIGWLDVLGYMNGIYDRQLARSTDPQVRRLCRERRIRLGLDIAEKSRGAGLSHDAWVALGGIFTRAFWYPEWWISAVKTLLRPITPRVVLAHWNRPAS